MKNEQFNEQEHEGERYLRLLDLGHVAEMEMQTSSGPMLARDFLEIEKCKEHARPALVGFEAMSPDDPRYAVIKKVLRNKICGYIGYEDQE